MQTLYSTLIKELHQYAKNNQYQRAVIGLSGGLDSAIMLCIASRAFGPKNVTALILPELGLTPNDDIDHAKILASHFGVLSFYQPINNFLVDHNFVTWEKSEKANQNLKSQTRNLLIQHYAESHNALYIGTANKSDFTIGYGNPNGEFGGELHPVGDLYKSELQKLAKFIGLPVEILKKESSRWLKPHQTDEADLGGKWGKIDEILQQLAEGADPEVMIEKGMDSLVVHKLSRLVEQNLGKYSHLSVIPAGRISEAITKAQAAEASSLS